MTEQQTLPLVDDSALRVPIVETEKIRATLGMRPRNFSAALGCHPGTYQGWLSRGELPRVAAIAARALLIERAPISSTYHLYRVHIDQKREPVLDLVASGNVKELTLDDVPYYLLPRGTS